MAKRKFQKKRAAGGGAKTKAAPGKKPAKRPAPKPAKRATNKSSPKTSTRGPGAAELPGRAASRVAAPASAPSRVRARGDAITVTPPPVVHPIDELSLAEIDSMRVVNNLDCKPGDEFPRQHQRGEPPPGSAALIEYTTERERRLAEAAPHLHTGIEADLYRQALWVAGGVRLPRAAIVGRALHERKSFSEGDAYERGSASAICQKINDHNPAHLSKAIVKAMGPGLKSKDRIAKLVGCLNRAWAILEDLQLLKAACGGGVYLVGLGPKVFDGFPDWSRPDDKPPKKPTRPTTKPPRS